NATSLPMDDSGFHSTIGPPSTPTAGPSIGFTRDGSNRITDVVGPLAGQHVHYGYTGNSLVSVTDPVGNTVTYTYDPANGKLQRSNDPNNQPLQTLNYDAGGRLVSIVSSNPPTTMIYTNLGAQQQSFLDPGGK